jgi:hypothetical protein
VHSFRNVVTVVFVTFLVGSSMAWGQAPAVSVSPSALSAELCPDRIVTRPLTI